MLNALAQHLQELSADTYKLLTSTSPKVKASKKEIRVLHKRYIQGLDLLKQIALRVQGRKCILNKCYPTYSELLRKNETD